RLRSPSEPRDASAGVGRIEGRPAARPRSRRLGGRPPRLLLVLVRLLALAVRMLVRLGSGHRGRLGRGLHALRGLVLLPAEQPVEEAHVISCLVGRRPEYRQWPKKKPDPASPRAYRI